MLETEIKKLTAAVEANTAALIGGAVAPSPTPVSDPKPAVPSASAAAVAVDIPVVDTPEPAADAAPVVVTLKQITQAIIALAQGKGRETAAALLAEYGAAKVPDLKKDETKYAEILAKATALLTA